jgi:hypothetical protein
MTGPVLRAGAWPAVVGVTGVAVVAGGCAAAFPAAPTTEIPVSESARSSRKGVLIDDAHDG